MDVLDRIVHRACARPMRIVLCEGEDPRVLEAAQRAASDGLAHIFIVGDPAIVDSVPKERLDGSPSIEVIHPAHSPWLGEFQQALMALPRKQAITLEQAAAAILQPLTFAMLMVRQGYADGSVAGAVHTTADVVRCAIQIVGLQAGRHLVSSFFIMLRDEPFHSTTHAMIFSDCGLVIDPNEEELADIAIAAADSAQALLDTEPKVAMLSFSTEGSAKHHEVDKVRHATELVRQRRPDLAIDGEVQLDAAIVPQVSQRKLHHSRVGGLANVLIFPNLCAANIAYKLTERLGHAIAIGPLLQGLNKPCNDLSRGCSADDIYHVIAATVVQAQMRDDLHQAAAPKTRLRRAHTHVSSPNINLATPLDNPSA